MSETCNKDNPCGEFGPTQKAATLWFIAVIAVALVAVPKLASIDSWMWNNNGEHLDYERYTENRDAIYSIPGERVDERQRGSYTAAASR